MIENNNDLRHETEKNLARMAKEAWEEYRKYNPAGDMLSMVFSNDTLLIRNSYFDKDKDCPLDYFEVMPKEETRIRPIRSRAMLRSLGYEYECRNCGCGVRHNEDHCYFCGQKLMW